MGLVMGNLSRIFISLPFLVGAFAAAPQAVSTAAAAPLQPKDALRILAHANAADAKCTYLNSADHDELSGYVAKAEVAAAKRHGVDVARTAIKRGRAAGKAMACGSTSRELVAAALDAARAAMAAVRSGHTRRQARNAQDSRRRPAGPTRLVPDTAARLRPTHDDAVVVEQASLAPATAAKAARPARPDDLRLAGYSTVVAGYYLERRCRHLSRADAYAFWQAVVKRHAAALASAGPTAVADAKARASARAGRLAGAGCNARTAAIVRKAYSRVR